MDVPFPPTSLHCNVTCGHNKTPETGSLNNRTLLLEMKAEIQEPAQLGSGRTHFLACRRLPSHVMWREKELPSVFYKGHQSYHGGPTLRTSFKPSHLPNQPPTGFSSILLWHCFFNLLYYWFGYILFANLVIWTNLVLYQLQVTSSNCDLLNFMIFYYTEDKFILTFMLICYIFIFSQEIFFFFFFALHGMRLLVPQPGTEHELPAVEAWSFNH